MGQTKEPKSLRSIATGNSVGGRAKDKAGPQVRPIRRLKPALFSVSYLALAGMSSVPAHAQTVGTTQPHAASQLPQIEITEPETKRRASTLDRRADRAAAQQRRSQEARQPEQAAGQSRSRYRRTQELARSAIMPTVRRSRPRPIRRWSTFRSPPLF
jgi:hypothetical protein